MKCLIETMFFIFLGVFLCSFTRLHMSEAEKSVNQLLKQIEISLSEKYRMNPIAVGVSMPGGVVKKLKVNFQIKRTLSKEEIRRILVCATQDFVSLVNANKDIKPFLENYPFEIKNIEIDLFIIGSNGYVLEHPNIGVAGIGKGKIDYTTSVTINNIPQYVSEERETYEEALEMIHEQTISQSKDLQLLQKN